MTPDQRALAWCYLTAAIAGATDGGSAKAVNSAMARFAELTDAHPIDVAAVGADAHYVRQFLLRVAERFCEHLKGEHRATMPTLSEADTTAALHDRNRALEDELARLRAGQ